MKFNAKLTTILSLVFCMTLCYLMVDARAVEKTVRQGISVNGIDISDMAEGEAEEVIKEYVDEVKSVNLKLQVNDETVDITVGELGYKWTNTGIMEEILEVGKKGNVIRRYKDELDIDEKGKEFTIEMDINKDDIIAALKELCKEYSIEAQNASLELTSEGFEVIPEKDGVAVDYEVTANEIYTYITEKWDKKSEIQIVAETALDEPEYTAEDLELVSDEPMGSYYTTFAVGSSYYNRNMNIQNGVRLLDEILLYPGEEYSLNDHLAPWTEENGYYPAGTYVDGGVTDSLGGGICQVSSTLYNALLLAEIEIVERYPHSMSVAYVPLAADAALAGDYKDLVFKNNTDAPIFIDATYTDGRVSFDVYGHDTREEGRTVKYVSETVSTKKIKTEVEEDDTKPIDFEEVVEEGHVGYTAKLWKYVYQDGEEIDKSLVNTSTYRMTPKKVIKGTKKDKDKDKNKDKDKDKKDKENKNNKNETDEENDSDDGTEDEGNSEVDSDVVEETQAAEENQEIQEAPEEVLDAEPQSVADTTE